MKSVPFGPLEPSTYRETGSARAGRRSWLGRRDHRSDRRSIPASSWHAARQVDVRARRHRRRGRGVPPARSRRDLSDGIATMATAATPATVVADVRGAAAAMLTAERTALNFMQRLSGIATLTRRYVDAAAGGITVLDTRKTTPTLRALEKYAVRAGGGVNHRSGLDDGILIKDNHIRLAGGVDAAVASMRAARQEMPIEVEAQSLADVDAAIAANADIILLDNLSIAEICEAVRHIGGRAQAEISGGVTLDRMPELARTGATYVSIGALTHSAPAAGLEPRDRAGCLTRSAPMIERRARRVRRAPERLRRSPLLLQRNRIDERRGHEPGAARRGRRARWCSRRRRPPAAAGSAGSGSRRPDAGLYVVGGLPRSPRGAAADDRRWSSRCGGNPRRDRSTGRDQVAQRCLDGHRRAAEAAQGRRDPRRSLIVHGRPAICGARVRHQPAAFGVSSRNSGRGNVDRDRAGASSGAGTAARRDPLRIWLGLRIAARRRFDVRACALACARAVRNWCAGPIRSRRHDARRDHGGDGRRRRAAGSQWQRHAADNRGGDTVALSGSCKRTVRTADGEKRPA